MKTVLILLASSVLVAGGVAASTAGLALSQAEEPARTVTIDVTPEPGPPGPPGPQGPPGPAGALDCGAGYTVGEVVFIVQGQGPTTIKTCLKD